MPFPVGDTVDIKPIRHELAELNKQIKLQNYLLVVIAESIAGGRGNHALMDELINELVIVRKKYLTDVTDEVSGPS